MKIQNGASALTGSACPNKATELFYVTHPKAPKALLGPFLSQADAECGRVVMRSAGDCDELERLNRQLERLAERFTPLKGAA